jgi:hypothetical protein
MGIKQGTPTTPSLLSRVRKGRRNREPQEDNQPTNSFSVQTICCRKCWEEHPDQGQANCPQCGRSYLTSYPRIISTVRDFVAVRRMAMEPVFSEGDRLNFPQGRKAVLEAMKYM